ncbi:unnamed protein product [Linum trigynum]|uniref:Uncharacterized protein n=1 Tax=Linum trigynum TaxID=586398 RepID=A0AAV2FX69_9ROSI
MPFRSQSSFQPIVSSFLRRWRQQTTKQAIFSDSPSRSRLSASFFFIDGRSWLRWHGLRLSSNKLSLLPIPSIEVDSEEIVLRLRSVAAVERRRSRRKMWQRFVVVLLLLARGLRDYAKDLEELRSEGFVGWIGD